MSPHAAIRNTERKKATGMRLTSWSGPWARLRCNQPVTSVHGRGDDDAHANGHGSQQDGQRQVLVFDDLLPQVVRRYFVEDHESRDKDENAHCGIDHRVHNVHGMKVVHVTFLLYSEGKSRNGNGKRPGCRAPFWV